MNDSDPCLVLLQKRQEVADVLSRRYLIQLVDQAVDECVVTVVASYVMLPLSEQGFAALDLTLGLQSELLAHAVDECVSHGVPPCARLRAVCCLASTIGVALGVLPAYD